MHDRITENLQITLDELKLEFEASNDPIHKEDLQRVINRLEVAIANAKGVGTLHNL